MTPAARRVVVVCLGVVGALGPRACAIAQPGADPAGGRRVFETKGCARCHLPREQGPEAGPALDTVRRSQGALHLAGRLWNHAPAMFATLEQQGLRWPELSRQEMADLLAYLQADPARDPAPDLFQGQVVLVRKGCLKGSTSSTSRWTWCPTDGSTRHPGPRLGAADGRRSRERGAPPGRLRHRP